MVNEMLRTFKLILIFSFVLSCQTNKNLKFKNKDILKEEFDICPWWKEGMTWNDFKRIKSNIKKPELMKYVNKIQANHMLKSKNIPVINNFIEMQEKKDISKELDKYSQYVAKPTHMSQNNGVMIIKNGINILTNTPISNKEVSRRMNKILETPSNSDEWLLQNMPKGFVIQEYIEYSNEIKIHTIWGQAIEVGWFQDGRKYHYYTAQGVAKEGSIPFPYTNIWKEAITLAERIAHRTDYLRVDIMIQLDDKKKIAKSIFVNELELRSQMGSNTKEFAQLLNWGYEKGCVSH